MAAGTQSKAAGADQSDDPVAAKLAQLDEAIARANAAEADATKAAKEARSSAPKAEQSVATPKAEQSVERVEAIVVYDVFCWPEQKPGGKPDELNHFRAFREQKVRVPREVFDRAAPYGALALPDDAERVMRVVASMAGPAADDSALAEMDAAELIAYVGQNPDEAARVYQFEAANQARPNVLRSTGLQDDKTRVEPAPGTGVTHNEQP